MQRSKTLENFLLIAVPLVILLALLAIWFFICTEFRRLAIEKGYRSIRYFHLCFWLGIFGMLIVIGLPDRKARPGYVEEPVPERQPPRQKEPKVKSMEPVTDALHRIGGHLQKTRTPAKPEEATAEPTPWKCSCGRQNGPDVIKCPLCSSWRCACGHINATTTLPCESCRKPLPRKTFVPRSHATGATDAPWACICGYQKKHPASINCLRCDSWRCSCGEFVLGSRGTCEKCGGQKP